MRRDSTPRDLPTWAVGVIAAVVLSCVAGSVLLGPGDTTSAPPQTTVLSVCPQLATGADDEEVAKLLESCEPTGARCFAEVLRHASASPQTIERARESCRARYAAALPLEPSSLERYSVEQLRDIRGRTFCLRNLGGDPPYTIREVDRAESEAIRSEAMPGYGRSRGGHRRGGGRCRDSRGRFTRCY